jgi:tRNA (mo5U34)-methyltransferase
MSATAQPDLRARVAGVPLWYHTLDLPGGIVTPGWFDLRGLVDTFPWPDVRGKRCLDVGTYDGFLAWEMERRGAAEVVAVDIPDHHDWDWPAGARARGGAELARLAGPEKGRGFKLAHEALGSKVVRVERSVYHLDPEELGTFDVVVCGSLMLHLRDPVRALEAIRRVCGGDFMSLEEVSLGMTLRHRNRPVAEMRFDDELCQWWVVNLAGHRRMVEAAGFSVLRQTKVYTEPYGPAHSPTGGSLRAQATSLLRRAAAGGDGVPHAGLLARPRLEAPPVRV